MLRERREAVRGATVDVALAEGEHESPRLLPAVAVLPTAKLLP